MPASSIPRSRRFRFSLLLACFLLSGLAGLIYETAWTRQFALVFGSSELAVAAVLAGYLLGLALGAAAGARLAPGIRRPLLLYAVLELGIALSALAVSQTPELLRSLHGLLLGGLDLPPEAGTLTSASFYLVTSFLVLLVPTGLMGATLPLLVRHGITADSQIGPRVGLLYTANTLGAAAGTLVAAYLLLPKLGLGYTILAAAGVNLLVFVLAALLARSAVRDTATRPTASAVSPEGPRWMLGLVLGTGFVALSFEVLWTRLLAHLLGGSLYAFATMLATFLAGLALGSALAGRWARNRETARLGFTLVQLGIAAASLAAYALIDGFAGLATGLADGGSSVANTLLAAGTLLPGALFMGASFPLAVRVLSGTASQTSRASGWIFAFNTLGSVAGAVTTGFVLLPGLGFAGTAGLLVAASLALGGAAALLGRPRHWLPVGAAAAGVLLLVLKPPATPWQVLRTSPLNGKQVKGETIYFAVGRSANVMLQEEGGSWRLTTNGLSESVIQVRGSRTAAFPVANWLGMLPQAARPDTSSLLLVGLGAGLTASAAAGVVREVQVVEIEPEVVAANRAMAGLREADPLSNPRVRLIVNDARNALSLSTRRFDAIVSQPSHPWTLAASNLFTREFFALAKEHLTPNGVFVQWIGLQFVDESLLRSLIATLHTVFPYLEVYQPAPGHALLFLASAAPLDLAATGPEALAAAPAQWRALGIHSPRDLVAQRVLDARGVRALSRGAEVSTDWRNLLQTGSPRILGRPLKKPGAQRLFAPYDPLLDEPDKHYLVRRLLWERNLSRAQALTAATSDPVLREALTGAIAANKGESRLGELALWRSLATEQKPGEAFYALLLLKRPLIERGRTPSRLGAQLAAEPIAAAVVEGWRLSAAGHEAEIRGLEPVLAAVDPHHSLYASAVRLRIRWRLAAGTAADAAQAIPMLDGLIALRSHPRDLLLRARLAQRARDPITVSASLHDLEWLLTRYGHLKPELLHTARKGVEILDEMSTDPSDDRSTRLRSGLEALAERDIQAPATSRKEATQL